MCILFQFKCNGMDASALPIGKIICETNYPPALNHLNFFLWVLVCVNPSFFFFFWVLVYLVMLVQFMVIGLFIYIFFQLDVMRASALGYFCITTLLVKKQRTVQGTKKLLVWCDILFFLFFEWYLVQHLSAKIERKGYTTLLSVVDSHVR